MKHSYILGMAIGLLATTGTAKAQDVALKTNLLGWATTSLNAGVEIGTAEKQTAQVFATLNPWTFSGEKRVRIWNIEPEYRWWTCQRFGGSFFGVHALVGEYNVKNVDLPFGTLAKTKRGRHYEGWYVGAGELTATNGCCRDTGTSRLRLVWATPTVRTSSTDVAPSVLRTRTATMWDLPRRQ